MNETWLHIGAEPNAARLLIKQVTGSRGVGLTRLSFLVEAATKKAAAQGCPLLFNGRVETLGVGGPEVAMPLTALLPFDQAPVLRAVGADVSFQLTADIDDRQLQLMEEHRNGAQRFRMWLSGTTFREGQHEPFYANNIDYAISQSDWIAILEQVGYARRYLVELDVPSPEANPKLAAAIVYFVQARRRYMEGEWRHCVESLRQCAAAIVGKKPDDEDELLDVQAALKTAAKAKSTTSIGYDVRAEQVRMALKFYCDLGAHPEVAETRRNDARAALVMVHGLLEAFREVG